MLFNSYAFVFAFLPLFVAGFYTIPYVTMRLCRKEETTDLEMAEQVPADGKVIKTHQKPACTNFAVELYCVILSFIFFSFFGIKVLGVLLISLLWNGIILYLLKSDTNANTKIKVSDISVSTQDHNISYSKSKPLLIIGICGNIALLLFFKYAGFFAEIISTISGSTITASILLPIAISFYTFSQISLLVDVYRGEVTELSIVDYLAYITFFPKILQGPIVRYNDMKDYFIKGAEHKWDTESFMQAVMLFVLGLSKKVIIADTLAVAVDYGYGSLQTLTPMDAILTAICYSFQIYFDFSGYCDMGRGICKMVGMDLPVNFESPYKARNIDDFWKRWHISLTAFFTRYVYIPLGGNRKGKARTYINFMIIFVLSGFWHGAGLTFIVWGTMHGLLYVVTRAISGKNKTRKLMPYPFALILTFIFVSLAWVFFRAETVQDAVTLISAMTRFKDYGAAALMISPDFIKCFQIDELWYIFKITPIAHMVWGPKVCMWLIILISAVFAFVTPNTAKLTEKHKVNAAGAVALAVLLVWSIIKFANVSTYIYLGF